ncbi:MAG: alanine racemase [Planctomycetes bacterium]|nr:alanine racemase [Planctomycetota bacterium]
MHTFRTIQHSTVQIDLGAIKNNCTVIRNHIGKDCGLCGVVKADGYGLGASRVASLIGQNASMLAVYSPDEAGEILNSGNTTPLLVLAPVHSIERVHAMYRGLLSGQLHLVLHDIDQLKSLLRLANRTRVPINVHVKVDTGLHRGGCALEDAPALIRTVLRDERIKLTGVMTHFISSVHDEALTKLQHERLTKVLHAVQTPLPDECIVHEANTAATARWKWTHRDMVRVGLAWTGTVPNGVPAISGLQSVVSWRSVLAHVKNVSKGEQVGYSGKWTAKRQSRIGIVPVGYAAGYPMGVGAEGVRKGASVRVFDAEFKRALGDAPIVGCVCMDQIAIDLTEISGNGIGCGVELISTNASSEATLEKIAQVAGVVPHAIISRISPKVHRTYIEPSLEVVTPNQSREIEVA